MHFRLGYLDNQTYRNNFENGFEFSASKSIGYVRFGLWFGTFVKFCRPVLFFWNIFFYYIKLLICLVDVVAICSVLCFSFCIIEITNEIFLYYISQHTFTLLTLIYLYIFFWRVQLIFIISPSQVRSWRRTWETNSFKTVVLWCVHVSTNYLYQRV